MIIRSIGARDFPFIEELNKLQEDFKLKSIDNCIIDKIACTDAGKPIAYGIVKKMAEAILLVDPMVPVGLRAQAMRDLMKDAEFGAKREHCEQLHCFVSNFKLAQTLEKHFGFVRSKDIVLVKDL